MADLSAAFGSRRYKFASEELEERCANLAISQSLSFEELALEYERLMMSRWGSIHCPCCGLQRHVANAVEQQTHYVHCDLVNLAFAARL